MNFDNDEDIMKAIMGGGGGGGAADIDNELAELEAELGQGKKKKGEDDELADLENELDEEEKGGKAKPKAKAKHDSDDELAALEKEGLDDEEEEKPKPKPVKKEVAPPPKPKPQPKKEEPKPKPKVQKGVDLYPNKTEEKYHNVSKMTSLGVLEEEDKLCDKIIAYKKERDEEYDDWENKKDSIKEKMETVTSFIKDEVWDLDMYKKKIKEQYQWESKLLQFVEKDPHLNDEQKKVLKERVNNRKKIIEKELTQNVEEEGGDQEEEPKKEEEVKKETKKLPFKNEILDTKKSLNPIFDVPKGKEEEEKNRLFNVVQDRLNEYRAALDYFKNNELAEQRIDATDKAKLICIELKKIQDGKWKEVNEFKLPDPVTPEYIYGYKKQQRLEKFKKIILELGKQRKTVSDQLNTKLADLKKHPSKIKKDKDGCVKELNELKLKKEKYDKIINLLKEKFQDVWVPAPLFVEQEKEIQIEKINKDVPENHVHIIFGKTTYSKDKSIYLVVKMLEEPKKEDKFDQKKPGEWTHQTDWLLEKSQFKNFFRAKIKVEIYEKKFFKDSQKGWFEMDPKELKTQSEFSRSFPINLESGRKDQVVEVTFKVRTPCKEPEFITELVPHFQVTKIYPPFSLKGNTQTAIKIDVQPTNVTSQDLNITKVNVKKPVQNKPVTKPSPQAPKQNRPPAGGKPAAGGPKKPSAPVDKSQFTEEELKDPDCIACLNTLMVLKFKQEKYEEIRNKIDGRTPRELMQRIIKIKCKYQSIENSLGDEISPQDYSTLLKATFEHDKKLLEYFKQIGDKDKFQLVNERLPLIMKETEELMKQMK